MSRGTAYYDLPNGERIELPTTMPDVEEVPGPLCDGKFELPEAVKEMFKWMDETFGTWESDFSSFKIWMKLRKNFNPPERWEAVQDKRRNPMPLGRNTYLYALPFDTTQLTSPQNGSNPHWGDPCHPLAASAHTPSVVVKVFDARGNGDGQIAPTITGDHESRIKDYTAIAVDLYNGAVTGDTAAAITCRSTAPNSGPKVIESYGIGNGQAHSSITKEKSGTLDTMHDAQAVAIECFGCLNPWDTQARRVYGEDGTFQALPSRESAGGNQQAVLAGQRRRWIVRRLTPTECERLQGYPDGWTDIGEWTDTKGEKHKPADSPRYKALGNSIALPQWFWIAQKMKLYMGDGAKLGSLFDGIGGFPLVWETTYGTGTARWASEIEEFPIAVTKKHFPERKEYEN